MSFNNIILVLLMVILLNKVLSRVLKGTEKEKIKKIDTFNIFSKNDFHSLVKKYVNQLGYSNLVEHEKGEMMVYNDREVVLVGYKQLSKLNEELEEEVIMDFIANMSLRASVKGLFITNGIIPDSIKDGVVAKGLGRFEIDFLDGVNLLVEFNKIKLNDIKGDIKKGEVAL